MPPLSIDEISVKLGKLKKQIPMILSIWAN
jgi:hypothetical protein